MMLRQSLATVFEVPEHDVRVLAPTWAGGSGPGSAPGRT
jgi:hypothetical protein